MATCSIGAAVFYFDSFSARFAFSFVLTLIGAQMTHATESYVNHVDQLTAPLKPIEPTNYPLGGSVHTAAQWVPIMVMVIFAYSRLFLHLQFRAEKLFFSFVLVPTNRQLNIYFTNFDIYSDYGLTISSV